MIRLHARWDGDDPPIGAVLKAQRGRIGYLITKVEPDSEARRAAGYRLLLTCVRIQLSEISPAQLVIEWKWDPRQKPRHLAGGIGPPARQRKRR